MPLRLCVQSTPSAVEVELSDAAPGVDLFLSADDEAALLLPRGTLADDYLDDRARQEVDGIAATTLAAWQAHWNERLELDGVCLPWLLQVELLAAAFLPGVAAVTALRRAFSELEPSAIDVVGADDATETLVRAAAGACPVTTVRPPAIVEAAPVLRARGLMAIRRAAASTAVRRGVPSCLRRGSVVVYGYWHLAPLVDRMLTEHLRPAVVLHALPPGPRRAIAAALRGGFVGSPSPNATKRACTAVVELLRSAPSEFFGDVDPALGAALHHLATGVIEMQAPAAIAHLAVLRRAFARGRPRRIVLPNDVGGEMRAALIAAREHGIPSLVVQHGVYLAPGDPPQPGIDDRIDDLESADEVAVWSPVTGAAIHDRTRPIHVIGYPLQHQPVERAPHAGPVRVLVLVQPPERVTVAADARISGRHASTAVAAVLAYDQTAQITLRPHPSRGVAAMHRVAASFPGAAVAVDTDTPIDELAARHDVCVASKSTATFQAARAGARVVVLNLTSTEWKWPLGGNTDVLVARSEDDLRSRLAILAAASDAWPGRDDLLETLGVPYGDGTERLLELLRG